jgi:hypothetical protein
MPSAFCYHAKPGGGKSEDLFPGDKSEHPYSWLDDTEVTAMSADGRFISIYEAGEVYALENSSLAYYRATDGSPAVRLGVGTAAISPLQSGQITCYLNRTYHVLTTIFD